MAPIQFTYEQLRKITWEFHEENIFGSGTFCKVYQGVFENKRVAVKAASALGMQEGIQKIHWETEKEWLLKLQHPHIIELIGYCEDEFKFFLVYKLMRRTVAQALEELDWSKTLKILRQSASVLCYMHKQFFPSVVFADFKTEDILIDQEYNVKICDFGMAKQEGNQIVFSTPGFTDPNVITRGKRATSSVDIYSFGVFILQLIMKSDEVSSQEEHISCWAMEEIRRKKHAVHKMLRRTGCSKKDAIKITKLGMHCCSNDSNARPTICGVIEALEQLKVKSTLNKWLLFKFWASYI